MGISGLLPVLKSITETKTLDQYKGQTLAIDGYCWLHRAIYSCSQEICLGQDTDKYIIYFIDRVNALLQNGVTPYVVFDGGPLPMKKGTEEERRKARAKNRELGLQSYRQKNYAEARKYFVRAADVSPFMAHCVIRRLKAMNVQYVVAPYEADAQLAFLVKNGLVDGVITEDSDCLPFGCSTVLFKMDRDGIAQEVRTDNLKRNEGLSFHMFTDEMFLEMCIFSGCDYLSSLPGFGLKKAYALMKQHGSYSKILRALRMEGKVRVPPTYETEFGRAVLTFRHQRVYDPRSKQLVPLTPVPQDLLDKDSAMEFLGPLIPHETAQAIAEGDMDPISCTLFPDQSPSQRTSTAVSVHALAIAARKADHSGFIHRKSSAAKSPPKAAPPGRAPNRTLPAWMSRKAAHLGAKTPSPASLNAPRPSAVTLTPKTISHFFATCTQNLSPSEDAVKTTGLNLSRQQSTESTYESQDPSEVDVARSITFAPKRDDAKHTSRGSATDATAAASAEKENTAPNTTKPPTPSSNENAFARMMRAGTMLHKHSLKRKGPQGNSSNKVSRFSGRVVDHHTQETPMERIKRLAFSRQPQEQLPQRSPAEASTLEPECELDPEAGGDSPLDDDLQLCIARRSVSSERLCVKATVDEAPKQQLPTITVAVAARTSKPASPVDAFARFRFGAK